MRTFKAKLAYDGTDYCGWQIQPGRPTIQGVVQRVLGRIEGQPVAVHGAGRTDAGVHALEEIISFRLTNPIPAANLRKAMNHLLPEAIRVGEITEVEASFHARHSATAKIYEYRIWRDEICPPTISRYVYPHPYPLGEPAMIEAAPKFVGTRDFSSLAAAGGDPQQSKVRTIYCSRMKREASLLVYRVRGSGFLYHMVRNIVGVLLEVGRGRIQPDGIEAVLAAVKRSAAGPTAPARGLFLASVEYGRPLA